MEFCLLWIYHLRLQECDNLFHVKINGFSALRSETVANFCVDNPSLPETNLAAFSSGNQLSADTSQILRGRHLLLLSVKKFSPEITSRVNGWWPSLHFLLELSLYWINTEGK
jgi:hypothetical protein